MCESLLQGYPAQTFMIMTLKTMTQLTVSSLVNLPAHVSRLLSILRDDLRFAVHVSCLRNLFNMAVSGPHLWDASNVEVSVEYVTSCWNFDCLLAGVCNLWSSSEVYGDLMCLVFVSTDWRYVCIMCFPFNLLSRPFFCSGN